MENEEIELYTNEIIVRLLQRVLEIKINNLEFIGRAYFDSITEYDFSLLKFNMIYDEEKNVEIYLKMIRGGKIKESIFCFWSLIYEEYLKGNNDIQINKKVIIKQKKANENNSNLILKFDQSLDYCAEINLIELKKFANNNKRLERWLEEKEIKSEDILFIGRKNYNM